MPRYNDDFPIAFSVFARTLVGSEDEIWTRLMANQHGQKKLSELGWRQALDQCKGAAPAAVR